MIIIWVISIIIAIASTILALVKLKPSPIGTDFPFITIIKQLKGVEPELEDSLESFFQLNYPKNKYEIIFCTEEIGDPAINILDKLVFAYPEIYTILTIQKSMVGSNPKVNNMLNAYAYAKELVLISDSGAKVEPEYLVKMTSYLEDDVGVVTGMVSGQNQKSFAGEIEATYLNTFFARARILADTIGFPTVMGMSMLFRKSDCEKIGGLIGLANYLAEDFVMGQKMVKMGLKIALMTEPVKQNLGEYTIKTFLNRHTRWGRLRKAHSPFIFLFEPLTMPLVTSII